MRLILALASLKFTPVGLVLLGIASIAVYKFDDSAAAWLSLPLLLLAVNLIAAVATNGVFRKQMPLLVFHLALIALVLLAAAGRLMYLKGRAEVTVGTGFAGLSYRDAGPLHLDRVADVHFTNEGFEIAYMAGPVLDRLVNRVRWRDDEGAERVADIELNKPLILFGYRIYPTSNKGFAPVLLWQPEQGEPILAAVHLPQYPGDATNQAQSWHPAGTKDDIWIMLEVEEGLIASDKPSRFRLPEKQKIIVRHQSGRWEMRPGDRIALPGGMLEYRELRTWMGYRFFSDWTIPWMLASCVVAVLSLSWHFWRKFASAPWNKDNALHGT
ncbi:MAG TPA: cytochrome c biogenesis protein ResB [Noviherbaspirillum sp.]